MRLIAFLLAAALPWLATAWAQTDESKTAGTSNALRVMGFNIRNSSAKDGENRWDNRREFFVATIRAFDPDLLGLQEVLEDQHDQLVESFPEYGSAGVARTDGVRKGEWSLIFFRKARFEQLGSGTFWLSEHPEEVGSKSWDAALERICSWAKLRDRKTGKELLYANTHFDHKGKVARLQSAILLREKLSKMAGEGDLILGGDFNTFEDDEPYKALVTTGDSSPAAGVQLIDSYREVHPVREAEEASFHAFKGTTAGSRIDWILHTAHFKATSAEIVRSSKDGRFPSDHYAVTAILEPK